MTGMDGRVFVLVPSSLSQQLVFPAGLRGRRILNGCEVERIRDDTSARVGIYASESAIRACGLGCDRTVKTSLRAQSTVCCAECRARWREHRGGGIDSADAAIALALSFGRVVDSGLDVIIVLCLNARTQAESNDFG